MIEAFQPEAPPVEIRAALENFRHNLWARHGRSVTLCYMASQVSLGAPRGLHPGSSSGGPTLHPEPTGAPRLSGGFSLHVVAPQEQSLHVDTTEV